MSKKKQVELFIIQLLSCMFTFCVTLDLKSSLKTVCCILITRDWEISKKYNSNSFDFTLRLQEFVHIFFFVQSLQILSYKTILLCFTTFFKNSHFLWLLEPQQFWNCWIIEIGKPGKLLWKAVKSFWCVSYLIRKDTYLFHFESLHLNQ